VDVYHTLTHGDDGVALVRLKYAARGSLEIHDAKMTQKIAISAPSHNFMRLGYIFTTKAYIDNRKKIVKQQYFLHMSL